MEDSENNLPVLPHTWQHVGGRVQDTHIGGWTNIPGVEEAEGAYPRVWSGASRGVAADTPPDPKRRGTGEQGGLPPPPPLGEAHIFKASLPNILARLRFLV